MKMPDQREKLTIEAYNKTAQDWADAHADISFWGEEFEVFNKLLPSGNVLEIGCGGGRDAELLINNGYNYLGTDPAEKFIETAQRRNPTGMFEVKRADEIDYPKDSFDGFWASAVLLHIPKNKIDGVLTKLKLVTKRGGIGFIAIKEGYGELVKEETSSDGNVYQQFWAFYTDEEFRKVLERNGFSVEEFIYKPMSERTKWLIYFVKS